MAPGGNAQFVLEVNRREPLKDKKTNEQRVEGTEVR